MEHNTSERSGFLAFLINLWNRILRILGIAPATEDPGMQVPRYKESTLGSVINLPAQPQRFITTLAPLTRYFASLGSTQDNPTQH